MVRHVMSLLKTGSAEHPRLWSMDIKYDVFDSLLKTEYLFVLSKDCHPSLKTCPFKATCASLTEDLQTILVVLPFWKLAQGPSPSPDLAHGLVAYATPEAAYSSRRIQTVSPSRITSPDFQKLLPSSPLQRPIGSLRDQLTSSQQSRTVT